ncbi:MAG TPA: hypothetical protein DDZ99_09920, partial [Clostridiales bacterium]|nr:hypothetical protein [Clostridiales bacterium]
TISLDQHSSHQVDTVSKVGVSGQTITNNLDYSYGNVTSQTTTCTGTEWGLFNISTSSSYQTMGIIYIQQQMNLVM